jgi:hypothetical protein
MQTIRVTISFSGKLSGALGITSRYSERRTISVSEEFTMVEAKEAARCALYYPENDSPAYQSVMVYGVAFN